MTDRTEARQERDRLTSGRGETPVGHVAPARPAPVNRTRTGTQLPTKGGQHGQ